MQYITIFYSYIKTPALKAFAETEDTIVASRGFFDLIISVLFTIKFCPYSLV